MKIEVKIDGIKAVQARLRTTEKQVAYAAAVALTRTAKAVQAEMPAVMDRQLDRPTPFTKGGLFVSPARRDRLFAIVGFKDRQASYLRWQIQGGTRMPTRKAQRLPSAVGLDTYGNLPKGLIGKLIAVARKESKLGKIKSRRIKVSNKLELFYGDPKDVGGHKFPPGIYKIVDLGSRQQLVPLIVFPAVAAKYKPRFRFHEAATAVVRREWRPQFDAALAEALRSAR